MPLTHQLAVIAYVIHNGKFLLLKRNHEPKVWGPPGGRLEINENPAEGILREVKEESGLDINLLGPADIWYGSFREGVLVSIDYLAETDHAGVQLSDEHSAFQWAAIDNLRAGNPPLADGEPGFKLIDFEKAWALYNKIKK
ncbi:NUDIX hydrolase [bacterium]|nr:NUDIX hydrolase [bacterium]